MSSPYVAAIERFLAEGGDEHVVRFVGWEHIAGGQVCIDGGKWKDLFPNCPFTLTVRFGKFSGKPLEDLSGNDAPGDQS